jgi:hypothetical protein
VLDSNDIKKIISSAMRLAENNYNVLMPWLKSSSMVRLFMNIN